MTGSRSVVAMEGEGQKRGAAKGQIGTSMGHRYVHLFGW